MKSTHTHILEFFGLQKNLLFLFLVISSVSVAQTTTWYLDNVTLNSGGIVRGSFDYDSTAGTFSNVTIRVANSSNFGTVTFTQASSQSFDTFLFLQPQGNNLTGQAGMFLDFSQTLINNSGDIDLTIGNFSVIAGCANDNCNSLVFPGELITGGRITTNPPPLTWYIDNVTLQNGGIVTGSFDFDVITGTYLNVNVTLRNSQIFGTVSFNANSPTSPGNPNVSVFREQIVPDYTNTQTIRMIYDTMLTAAGGTVTITPSTNNTPVSFVSTCADTTCSNLSVPADLITGGRVTTDPPPTAVCQDISVALDDAGNASITTANIDAGSTDDQPGFTLSLDRTTFTCADVGANTVTLTITASNGATDSCTATVTVVDSDETSPTITCAADITVSAAAGSCTAMVTVPTPTVVDNCSFTITNTITNSSDASGTYPVGTTTITWTATDPAGWTDICTQNITVTETVAPTISCDPISVGTTANSCDAMVSVPLPVLGDNCGTTLIPSTPRTPYNFSENGTLIDTPVTLQNLTTATQDVRLKVTFSGDHDTGGESFIVFTPDGDTNLIQYTSITPVCTATERFVVIPVATWNSWINTYGTSLTFTLSASSSVNRNECPSGSNYFKLEVVSLGDVFLTNDYTNASDASGTYPLGTTAVTWTVTDLSGNTATCIQNITVNDTEAPVISCASDVTINADSGACNALIILFAPTVSDNCSNVTITNDFNNNTDTFLEIFPVGTTTVTWTAMDQAGNINTCEQIITVNDTQVPMISCTSDIEVNTDAGMCNAMVTVPSPTTSDNCPITLTNDFNNTADASGIYPVGTTLVTWTATDLAGNASTCTQNIVVNDTENPVISCPADVTLECGEIVNYMNVTATDNCGFPTVPGSIPNTVLLGTFGNSTYFVDTRDLDASIAFTESVASGYDLVTINSAAENEFLRQQAANLNITTPLLLGYNDIDTEGTFAWQSGQPTTYTSWESGDPNGSVADEDYVLSFDGLWFDIVGNSIARIVYEVHDYSAGAILVSGIASGAEVTQTTVNTFFSKDIHGNISMCTQTITVNDTQAPTITCPVDITVTNDASQCNSFLSLPPATASDNCAIATITNDFNNTADASGTYPVGTTVVTWTATDTTGNTSTCTQNITVNDAETPTISCPADITVNNDVGMCTANVTVTTPTVSDNCAVASVTNDFNNSSDASGIYPVGTTVVTWTVTDTAGNVNTCIQNITVTNMVPPTITCPADIFVGTDPDMCNATVIVPQPTFSDNCPNVTITNSFTNTADASGVYPVGQTIVTWTATDANGNSTSCTQRVTVEDNQQPIVSCAPVNVSLPAGQCSTMVTVPLPTISENCAIASATNDFNGTSDASGTYDVGSTTVRWTVTDINGRTNTCTQKITVTEPIPPSIFCPNDITVSCAQVVNYNTPATAENCSFIPVPTSVPNFTLLGTFGNSTYFLSNSQFQSAAEAFSLAASFGYDLVTINTAEENDYIVQALGSTSAGTIFLGYNDVQTEGSFVWQSGQPNFYENWDNGQPQDASFNSNETEDYVLLQSFNRKWYDVVDATPGHVVIEFSDYSNGMTTQVAGLPSGSFFTETTVNTFFSKDASGNSSTCSITVIVEDTEGPTMVCPTDITMNADANSCDAMITVPIPDMIADACGDKLIPSTGKIPYNFSAIQLIDTPATLYNATTTLEDVQLQITYTGAHNAAEENFVLVGPDNATLLNESGVEFCATITRTLTIPTATWNTWVSTYGANLTFKLLANPNVNEERCLRGLGDFFKIDVINQGKLVLTNDFTNTPNASGVYPIGTTTVTWTITDLAQNSTTCTQSITVTETEPPVISCPSNITVNTDTGLCSAVVNFNAPTVTDNCTVSSLQNVLNNFNQNNQQITSLIPNPYNFDLDVGVNSYYIDDGGSDMYDEGNFVRTDLNTTSIYYSDNVIDAASTFGTNGAVFTRKVDNMWLLAADLDNVNTFDITGDLGADGSGLADGFTSTITVNGVNYNLFVKRVREETTVNNDSDASVNHLIIIPENTNATQNFSTNTNNDQHQVTGLLGTTRLYYLLFASENSGLIDDATMEAIATSFITNTFSFPGTMVQTTGLASGSAFPVGTTTNTFVATDVSGNSSTCSFTVTVNDPTGNCDVKVSPKVYLQGSVLNSTIDTDGLMRDDLRVGGHIPLDTPYSDTVSIQPSVLNTTGTDAIVDWIWVELRDELNTSTVVSAKSALLQRDGDVVDLDGTSPVQLGQFSGNYHIVIKHRNHLGIMTNMPIALNNVATTVDFTNGSIETFGSYAQTTRELPSGNFAMWAGDANGDSVVQYEGGMPDISGMLSEVLDDPDNTFVFPTFTVSGYSNNDVNMDGNVQYAGVSPETPLILQNVLDDPKNLFNFNTWSINAQLPLNTNRAMQLRNAFENSKF